MPALSNKYGEEKSEELCLSSNEAADLVRDGQLEAAEKAARILLERFPDEPDGHDRLGMVHQARGDNGLAAKCYRKAVECIKSDREHHDAGLEETLRSLADELDSP